MAQGNRQDKSGGERVTLVFTMDGKRCETTKNTLMRQPPSFFTRMLSGEVDVPRNEEGHYLINRYGTVFDHVLCYLEMGYFPIDKAPTSDELEDLCSDADFFQLPELRRLIVGLQQANFNLNLRGLKLPADRNK